MDVSANAQTNAQRTETLAIVYQEVLTGIVRLRTGRQAVADATSFRFETHSAINAASAQALAASYSADDVKMATFAAVAFLDESVLNSQNAIFADWSRKPLQEEIFGTHIAGEVFYRNLQHLLSRNDSPDLADLLEIYYLCMLLGFGGRYRGGGRGELAQNLYSTGEKIWRIRGRSPLLSPAWSLPGDIPPSRRDRWLRRFGVVAVASAALAILLFVVFKLTLNSGLPGAA